MGENDWWGGFEKKYLQSFVGILGTRCFSSMLPSIPKGEIVRSMNVDDIPMQENCRNMIKSLSRWYVTFMIVFVIDVNIEKFLWYLTEEQQ